MKAIPFKVVKDIRSSILRQTDTGPYFYDRLHYHPEFQITSIVKGNGMLYGGANTRSFSSGDVLIFGENMPHLLKNSAEYYGSSSPGVLSYSLFFRRDCFGADFFQIPEMKRLERFLSEARRGCLYRDDQMLQRKLLEIRSLSGERLVLGFLEFLSLAMERNWEYLNESVYCLSLDEKVGGRLNSILQFTFANLTEKIHITDVAAVANLSPSQFSRYFKRHTGKSYIQFLNEVRIEEACRLLSESDDTVEAICYTAGFQNVSNFNRCFKAVKGETPRAYRKRYVG